MLQTAPLPRPWRLGPFSFRPRSPFDLLPAPWGERLAFSLRAVFASLLALDIAFALQLDAPYWAAMTIWMVAQPTPGMAVSRGFYRIVGTLVGALAGVVLMACFAQTPELFIFALALWVGATTLASNLLRNFRSYGAVLAGYTAAIVALGAYHNPEHTLEIAFARGSATIIGIACFMLVASLFAPHRAYAITRARLRGALAWTARRAALPAATTIPEKIALGAPLINELILLDTEVEFAAAESPEFRLHAATARSLLAHLIAAIAAKRSMDARLLRAGPLAPPELPRALADADTLFHSAPGLLDRDQAAGLAAAIAQLRARVAEIDPITSGTSAPVLIDSQVILDRLDDLLRHLDDALQDWASLEGASLRPATGLHLNFHRDHRAALINGARAFLAVIAAGAFWIASAWSSGTGLVIMASVVCSLFSAFPRPDRAGLSFLTGAALSLPCAFVWNFFILQNVSGFPLLAFALALFLVPAALFLLDPRKSLIAVAACVNFIIISRPTNPMDYDVVSFLNNAVATVAGVAFGVLAYRLFLPPDPAAARRYVIHRLRQGLGRLAAQNPIPIPCDWQTRTLDRINRLHDPANLSATPTDEWLEGGLASLEFGNEILRLRLLLRDDPVDPAARPDAESVLAALADRHADTTRVTASVQLTHGKIAALPPSPDAAERRSTLRLLGLLEEMQAFYREFPNFLTP
jgi:uncharacterized membrane protein YccC